MILLPAAAVVGALGWAGVELIKRNQMLSSGFWGGWVCLMGALSILTASVVWWGVEHDRVTAYVRKKHWAYEMAKKKADEGDSLENLPGSISSSLTNRDLSERAAHVERFDDAVERWRDTMLRTPALLLRLLHTDAIARSPKERVFWAATSDEEAEPLTRFAIFLCPGCRS